MPIVFSNDARISRIDFKNEGSYRDTYSALRSLNKLALDWFGLSECPGSDWDKSWLLKVPLAMVSISSFFCEFSNFVLPLSAIANPYLVPCGLLMYYIVC